ncbi:MAG: phage tail protein [Nitrosomonas sp.]|uniref:GPW/gp25 family protein n=1 Tax=Nitrosomonas sp. TaxID=42353 RepID=UPI0032ED566C
MSNSNNILGHSLSFPLRIESDGRFAWSEGESNIRESLTVILKTEPGERIALPDFGAGLGRFLFEPNNAATHARIERAITGALTRWERRIQVESVEVVADHIDLSAALATITYRLVATSSRERISVAVPLKSP